MTSALLEKIKTTQSSLDRLDYDEGLEKTNTVTITQSSASNLFVFHQSDLDAASYYLARSLEDPLNPSAIKFVFVQESCVQRFSGKLKRKLKPTALTTSTPIIAKLNAKTIRLDAEDGPSPVVSLLTFGTVEEAINLSKKESVSKNATIWCENHATAYELIDATSLENYYLNCYNVPWTPIQEYISKQSTFVVIEGSYHYETLVKLGMRKNIVFPFGTSFAN